MAEYKRIAKRESEPVVKVTVDVTKIVKYCCITATAIVAIVFMARTFFKNN
ncbi:MAG: hypothetical protein K6G65_08865 [Lachnospiraceae bacterium]|nr:hypothetical protein [Lachnospiraceae bacterium]